MKLSLDLVSSKYLRILLTENCMPIWLLKNPFGASYIMEIIKSKTYLSTNKNQYV